MLEELQSTEITCLNCETRFTGHYCPNCGQSSKEAVHVSVLQFIKQSVLDFLFIDVRLWLTLRFFFLKPGFLTNEYNSGRRILYIPPFKLYLFITFVLLIVISFFNQQSKDENRPFKTNKDSLATQDLIFDLGGLDAKINTKIDSSALSPEGINKSKDRKHDSTIVKVIAGINQANQTKEGFQGVYLRYLSRILFLLMPIMALMLMLIYIRSNRTYVEHLIFSVHFHAFFFAILLFEKLSDGIVQELNISVSFYNSKYLLMTIPFYLFFSLRRVYGQNWIKTFIKYGLLVLFYGLLFIVALLMTIFFAFGGI